jgi:Fe-S cluster assembly protein SufD
MTGSKTLPFNHLSVFMHPILLPEQIQTALGKKQQSLTDVYSWESIQRKAADYLQQIGLPGPKAEDYTYSHTSHWLADLPDLYQSDSPTIDHASVATNGSALTTDYRVQLINGSCGKLLSTPALASLSYQVQDFGDTKDTLRELIDKHFCNYDINNKDPFAVLNTALFNQGTLIYIPDNTNLDKPLWIDHFIDNQSPSRVHYPRLLIWVGKQAQVNLIHDWHTMGEHKGFTNSVIEIGIEEGAHVSYYNLQFNLGKSRQINTVYVYQAPYSSSRLYTITGNSQRVRNNLHLRLQGSNSHARLYGLYRLSDEQQVDNQTTVDHQQPGSTSYELYKGIITDQATGIFNGKIYVQQPAQQTNAFQRNNTLLLSPGATIHTKPQLKIWADNVKCSHGATVGQLDEDALFYLSSRGIPPSIAQGMLMEAFVDEVIQTISPSALQLYIKRKLLSKVSQDTTFSVLS